MADVKTMTLLDGKTVVHFTEEGVVLYDGEFDLGMSFSLVLHPDRNDHYQMSEPGVREIVFHNPDGTHKETVHHYLAHLRWDTFRPGIYRHPVEALKPPTEPAA